MNAGVSAEVETVSNVPRGLTTILDGMLETNDEKLWVRTFGKIVRGTMLSKTPKLAGAVGPS